MKREIPRIVELADRLEADIVEKKLQPGDAYLSTRDVARMLGVGGAAANRALQLLEKRRVIIRRQRLGAVIAPPREPSQTTIRRVHFLVHEKYWASEGVGADGILLGLQQELPAASVGHFFLPGAGEEELVESLVRKSLADGEIDGFVLVRTNAATQRMVVQSGLPAVVHGTPYPSIENLAWIDRDHAELTRLLVEFLHRQGRRRLAVFFRQQVLPGDHVVLDTLHELLVHRMPIMRFLPSDERVIQSAVEGLLANPTPPDGWLCQNELMADVVARAIRHRGGVLGRDADVVVQAYYLRPGRAARYPHVLPELSAQQIGQCLGRTLVSVARREAGSVHGEAIPVRLQPVPYAEG